MFPNLGSPPPDYLAPLGREQTGLGHPRGGTTLMVRLARVRPAIWLLLATAVFVLAASNLAHLSLARGADRYRELAMRQAIGASPCYVYRLMPSGLDIRVARRRHWEFASEFRRRAQVELGVTLGLAQGVPGITLPVATRRAGDAPDSEDFVIGFPSDATFMRAIRLELVRGRLFTDEEAYGNAPVIGPSSAKQRRSPVRAKSRRLRLRTRWPSVARGE